ncbi:hypothetical protein HNR42_002228 [Deinobacterium chartae]|uniref:Probable queuosine precursor transporter n=1 Tax=Deinobacterium chartae TaxID=521158 RepID=A0A841I0Q7_9DEIO|nr:queuosine precursor transporter [Deinobacterium chartae]MBB6098793.1 hypothetical protein [Deinobacterium chartae]
MFRYFDIIVGLFVAVLLISNLASSAKIVQLGPFVYDAGTLLFPLSYLFGDLLTEVYGYARARRAIWIGFMASALFALTVAVVGIVPGEAAWAQNVGQDAYNKVLASAPRIVLASFVAYLAGSFVNAYIMARLKVVTRGRYLWTRTIGSTVIGQAVDTALFVLLAFLGAPGFSGELIWSMIASNYLFKVGLEVVLTPLTYAVVRALKRAEKQDVYDERTNFNPFRL